MLADSHGNAAAFPERECSVRRIQKVLEESPSCLITASAWCVFRFGHMCAMYHTLGPQNKSAGTVEMICASDLSFYILEMNTRLQVEHPVTECVTDVDLVEQASTFPRFLPSLCAHQMLNIAAGRPMSDHLIKQV
ncbi:unnamed protein product [Ectocarpus sp. 12 AP-2014]